MAGPSVYHYVHFAWPRQIGCTIRTTALVLNLMEMGYRCSVIQWMGPEKSWWYSKIANGRPIMVNDGITYYRPHDDNLSEKPELRSYANWLLEQAGRPDFIHAHSDHHVAREARHLAGHLGVPWLYEVRGFWDLSIASNLGQAVRISEAIAGDVREAGRADHVIAICKGIADALVAEGVPASKITVVPNGVDPNRFSRTEKCSGLVDALGLHGKLVFGYMTNVRRLEGIQTVIEAWPQVVRELPDAVFLVVGDGDHLARLKELAARERIEDHIKFTGQVPHPEVLSYYSLLDVFVVPRIPDPVCTLVSPLKPLEAMAMGLPVVASDLPPLTEMVRDQETGLLFRPGDPQSLADACIRIGRSRETRKKLGEQARTWVERERDWKKIAALYKDVYARL